MYGHILTYPRLSKGEHLSSVFSRDGTLISTSAALHCGDLFWAILWSANVNDKCAEYKNNTNNSELMGYKEIETSIAKHTLRPYVGFSSYLAFTVHRLPVNELSHSLLHLGRFGVA